jgi:hypothetical protein
MLLTVHCYPGLGAPVQVVAVLGWLCVSTLGGSAWDDCIDAVSWEAAKVGETLSSGDILPAPKCRLFVIGTTPFFAVVDS